MMEEECKWSESVEDLVHCGDVDKAISLLESVVSKFQTLNSSSSSSPFSNLELSSALFDLSKLYNSKGFSLKADHAYSRAITLREGNLKAGSLESGIAANKASIRDDSLDDGCRRESSNSRNVALPREGYSDDDWEVIADRSPDDLLSPECLPGVSKLSLEDTKTPKPKRRGRGTFSYRKHGLYSDQLAEDSIVNDSGNEDSWHESEGDTNIQKSKYGTRHVLVLADFAPSTRTTDLEKLLENFKDRGFVIRWVNDTTALAVFRTPSDALEASNGMKCPFTVRILGDNDILLSSIPARDVEPPRQRPKTSASTAKRLIAHEMGIKLPSTATALRKQQEEARRNRILSRQNMRDDAWGDDDHVK